ncbi:hypothetical protein BpHYR1_049470 [Brachionus plicatilis]|uniref:Uncharacterized protein n=1 Tax=Brachionus plicatilis TaxID=10195 RepID=A0A3M7RE17_BRAPC|nr:hypothetical protein BpHYR1_049470 [Brachionus plicatilis]
MFMQFRLFQKKKNNLMDSKLLKRFKLKEEKVYLTNILSKLFNILANLFSIPIFHPIKITFFLFIFHILLTRNIHYLDITSLSSIDNILSTPTISFKLGMLKKLVSMNRAFNRVLGLFLFIYQNLGIGISYSLRIKILILNTNALNF